ncbi:hypothetical protein Pmar_PMAR006518, partial [Perkinsus marinus ATCC 50983]
MKPVSAKDTGQRRAIALEEVDPPLSARRASSSGITLPLRGGIRPSDDGNVVPKGPQQFNLDQDSEAQAAGSPAHSLENCWNGTIPPAVLGSGTQFDWASEAPSESEDITMEQLEKDLLDDSPPRASAVPSLQRVRKPLKSCRGEGPQALATYDARKARKGPAAGSQVRQAARGSRARQPSSGPSLQDVELQPTYDLPDDSEPSPRDHPTGPLPSPQGRCSPQGKGPGPAPAALVQIIALLRTLIGTLSLGPQGPAIKALLDSIVELVEAGLTTSPGPLSAP